MKAGLSVRAVTRAELRSGDVPAGLDDPDGLAAWHPGKRQALLANPLARGEQDVVQLLGLAEGRVVGRVDLLAGEITADGAPLPVVWGSALAVPEAWRHTGIGLMLILRMQSAGALVGACGISQAVRPIYEKLNWAILPMDRYVLVHRSRAFLASIRRPAALAAPLVDTVLAAPRALAGARAAAARRRYRVEPATALPPEIAPRLGLHDGAAGHRSPSWMAWLLAHDFDDLPSRRKALYLVRDRESGEVLGYFLVKSRFFERATQREIRNVTIGSVQDWLSLAPGRLSDATLVFLAVDALLGLAVDAVEICTADAALGATLRRAGMVRMGRLDFVYRAAPRTPLADPVWRDPRRWRLRPAESDNFFT